jgi:hypothetical protein
MAWPQSGRNNMMKSKKSGTMYIQTTWPMYLGPGALEAKVAPLL